MEHLFCDGKKSLKTFSAAALTLLIALDPAAFSAETPPTSSADSSTKQRTDSPGFVAKAASQTAPQTVGASASQATLDFANGLYARKMYGPAITEYEKFLKADPASPEAASSRFRYADSFYFTKDYAAAIAHFELFLKSFPADKRAELAQFRLGTARYYQGDRARAIQTFVQLSEKAEDTTIKSGAIFYLAKSLESKGQADESLRLFERIVAEFPRTEYASYAGVAIGDRKLQEEKFDEAVRGYQIAAENPTPPELSRQARFKTAEIRFSQKAYAEAAVHYQKVYEDPTQNEDDLKDKALLALFYCDYYAGDLAASERRLSADRPVIESSSRRAEILFVMAGLLSENKKYEEALRTLQEVIVDGNADPALKEKAEFKKIAVLSQKGQKEESLKELESLFAAKSGSADKVLFEKGKLLAEIGKIEEALAAFGRLVQEHPASEYAKSALYQQAVVQMKAGRAAEAKKGFGQYASRYASDANADLALLQIVQMDLDAKLFEAAFTGADDFIRQHPSSERLDIAYYKLGVAATSLKRFGHAGFAFQKIADNYPASKLYVEALYGAAASLENAHKVPESIALYEKLLRDHPDHALSRETASRLGYLYIQNNDTGKVLTYYEDLIFNKKDVPLETDGVFWLIQYLLDQGLYDRLNRILEVLEARFPGKELKHEKLFFQAESAMGMRDYDRAAGLYSQAIAAKAEGQYLPHAYLGQGIALAAVARDAEAQQSFAEALRYDHEVKIAMRARFEMANLLLKGRQYDEAAKAFMLVAILYDDAKYAPPALYKAGECFRALKRTDEAEKAFQELKSRYPESEWANKVRTLS